MAESKKRKFSLSPFSIILILTVIVAICTWFVTGKTVQVFDKDLEEFVEVTTKGAVLGDVLNSVAYGFYNAADVITFVFILGGFLGLVAHSGALEAGIAALVRKLKGHELVLIPILMFVFSICGSTYGMLEETVGFYALLAGTMVAAGMDTIVGSATVLLGAGCGVLGSTVNPFAVGAAVTAAKAGGAAPDMANMMIIGAILWIVSYAICVFFVLTYAKKVKADKGSTFLTLQEQEEMAATYGNKDLDNSEKLTKRQIAILVVFGLTFLIMILMFIPWFKWDATPTWTSFLYGLPFGDTYMLEAGTHFLLFGIIIALIDMVGREEHVEKKIVDTFLAGCTDMMSVCMVIGVARGVSVLMTTTGFSAWLVNAVGQGLKSLPEWGFTPINYLFEVVLSVLVPSSSGIAALSGGIMGPIAANPEVGYSVDVVLMTMVAANGVVNLITPTCGAIMGGLALAKVDYSTWVKFSAKIVACLAVASIVILTILSFVF